MKSRYISIFLIICLSATTGILSSACTNKKALINHKSRYSQVDKYQTSEAPNVIDLSDGRRVNFGGAVGPGEPHFGADVLSTP